MKERPIIIVLAAPLRKRKDFSFRLNSSELINEAWPDPMPGRKEKKGTINMEAERDLMNSLFSIFIYFNG